MGSFIFYFKKLLPKLLLNCVIFFLSISIVLKYVPKNNPFALLHDVIIVFFQRITFGSSTTFLKQYLQGY
jgi:hypothetical protein